MAMDARQADKVELKRHALAILSEAQQKCPSILDVNERALRLFSRLDTTST